MFLTGDVDVEAAADSERLMHSTMSSSCHSQLEYPNCGTQSCSLASWWKPNRLLTLRPELSFVRWFPIVEPYLKIGQKFSGLQYLSYVSPKVLTRISMRDAGVVQDVLALWVWLTFSLFAPSSS